MTVKLSTTVRNAIVSCFESEIGTAPILYLRSGSPPSNITDSDSGTLIVQITLPSDWLTVSNGVASKNGTWSATASAAGTIGHFRLKDSSGTTTHIQGTVTITGSGGDMTVDNPDLQSGQTLTVTSFTITAGGA